MGYMDTDIINGQLYGNPCFNGPAWSLMEKKFMDNSWIIICLTMH